MSQRARLIHAIRCAPDDPAPALVYADWLQDRDDPRGELIALEYAGIDEPRRRALLGRHADEWLEPLRALGAFRPELDRGLVRWVTLRGHQVANLEAACELEPVVGAALDSAGERPAAGVAAQPALAQLRSLHLGGTFDAGCEIILASPHLAGLESLSVFHRLTEERAAAIVASGARPRRLMITPDGEATALLAAGSTLERLRHLTLHGADADLADLGDRLDQLETLKLLPVGRAGVDTLVRHITGGNLRELDLHVEDPGAQARLLGSRVLAGLEVLDMQITDLCPAAIRALQNNPHRARLRSMWLPATRRRFELPGVDIEWEGW